LRSQFWVSVQLGRSPVPLELSWSLEDTPVLCIPSFWKFQSWNNSLAGLVNTRGFCSLVSKW
jgi:hypothetical protein